MQYLRHKVGILYQKVWFCESQYFTTKCCNIKLKNWDFIKSVILQQTAMITRHKVAVPQTPQKVAKLIILQNRQFYFKMLVSHTKAEIFFFWS